MTIDLSGLRDIQAAVAPEWWPPAVGWWVLAGGICVVIGIGVLSFVWWYRQPKQFALRELKQLYRTYEHPVVLARQMSALFKRVALVLYPRERTAKLAAEDWQAFLGQKTNGALTQEQTKLLAFSTYLPDNTLTPDSREALYEAGRRGIIEMFRKKR